MTELTPVSIDFQYPIATRIDADYSLEKQIKDLPEFTSGTADNPGEGYELVDTIGSEELIKRFIRTTRPFPEWHPTEIDDGEIKPNIDKLKRYIRNSSRKSICFRYRYETYEEVEADVNGERRTVYIPDVHTATGYWRNDEFLLLHGQSRTPKKLFENLTNQLSHCINFDKIRFESDFLLWLVYKFIEQEPLTPRIEIQEINSAQFIDSNDSLREIRKGETEKNDLDELLSAILSGGEIVGLGGVFDLDGIPFSAYIVNPISLHLGAYWPGPLDEDVLEFYSALAEEIIELYYHWRNMANDEKYPPPSFFINIYREIGDKLNSESILDQVIEKYTLKRTEGETASEERESEVTTEEQIDDPRQEEIYDGMTIGDALEIVESEILESKRSLPDQIDQIAKEVAALANTQGGVVILGISDDGELVGLSNAREIEERVAGVITHSIEPSVNVTLMRQSIADADLLIISVDKANQIPRSVNGKYYKRVGTTTQELSPEELIQKYK